MNFRKYNRINFQICCRKNWKLFPRNSTRNFQKICRLIFQRCLFETHCGPRRFFFFFNSKSTIFPSTFVIFCTHLNVVFVYVNCSIREIASHLFVFFKIWEFWKKKVICNVNITSKYSTEKSWEINSRLSTYSTKARCIL